MRSSRAQDPPLDPGVEYMVAMRDAAAARDERIPPRGRGAVAGDSDAHALQQKPARRGGRGVTRIWGTPILRRIAAGDFGSEGSYEPYQADIEDGYDTVEWIAEQPWCDGKVGISGRSAAGINANLAAASDPPHLVCAYIVTATESLFDESYFIGGVFREHFRGNFMRLQGVADQIPIMKRRVLIDEQWRRDGFRSPSGEREHSDL